MLRAYLSLMRLDNWPKNLLMLVGVAIAAVVSNVELLVHVPQVLFAFISLCLASSANYVLNEALDARTDAYHPLKKNRSAVKHNLKTSHVACLYILLVLSALWAANACGHVAALLVLLVYLAAAWVYNIPPVRVKDRAYLDVMLEAVNYPLRLLLGWISLLPHYAPPTSLLLTGWAIGAFLMSLKRLAEYQIFQTSEQAVQYRRSYAVYNRETLLLCSFFYALLTVFGLTILMLKYRTELLLLMPLLAAWMGWCLLLGCRGDTSIIYPERLLYNRIFLLWFVFTITVGVLLLNVDIEALQSIYQPLKFQ